MNYYLYLIIAQIGTQLSYSRAAFLTCYLWSCDFLPTLFMIIIFSPSRYRYRKLGEFLESENGQSLACLRQP
jgi:hypothetical protein